MSIRVYAAVIAMAMGLFSCGFETSDEDKFNDRSKNRVDDSSDNDADATASRKSTKKNKNEDLDCSEISLHGFHLTCDEDDIAAKEDNLKNKEDETTEVVDDTKDPEDKTDDPVDDKKDDPVDPPVVVTPPKDPNIVEFRIKAGTGTGGWNTQAEIIDAKIGQTIRVFNDDTVVHRLHTGNNAPCPHGQNIPVGGSADCVVGKAFDSNASNGVYDHIVGPSAKIWIKATN